MKRIALIQSAYIPWRGFFDLIGRCDEYVIYDTAQFSKGHWHNRNKIKTSRGSEWITIPVVTRSKLGQPIEEVEIAEPWAERHWRTIELHYRQARYFSEYSSLVRSWFDRVDGERLLTNVNEVLLREIAQCLGIKTRIRRDREVQSEGRRTERIVSLCRAVGATQYLSGPSARSYIDEDQFRAAGIVLEWMEYGPYPEYEQLHGAFEPSVTVLDVLFNCGAAPYMVRRLGAEILESATGD
jgi:hypothetical protein